MHDSEGDGEKVTFGYSRKISDKEFGSYEFFASYTTRLGEEEVPEDGLKRARRVAEGFVVARIKLEERRRAQANQQLEEDFEKGNAELDKAIAKKEKNKK